MGAIVVAPAGTLEGAERRGFQVFRGIPYARAPVGGLRFRAPEPPEPWTGVRSVRRFSRVAPQAAPANRLVRAFVGAAHVAQSEDCLYLNVWTPCADRRRRPVMVWLHGGGFILGAGSTLIYDGSRLAKRGDVVVVTLNYRLGALGYLNWRSLAPGSGDSLPDANLGLRDQIVALEWVRDNIECFGGDPDNVTLFGESAGAMSVGTLLGVPRARGLFHKAILQSGAAHNVASAEQATTAARHFLAEVGIGDVNHEALEALSLADIMRSQLHTTAELGVLEGILPWQPSLDDDLLPEPPLAAIAKGLARSVPMLVGTNRDEWSLFLLTDPRARSLDEERLARRFRRILARLGGAGAEVAKRATQAYRRVSGPRGASPVQRWIAFQSDRIFHYPAVRLADLHCFHTPDTYAYLFEWTPPLLSARIGACHGLEIPFVFDTMRHPLLRPLLGSTRSAYRLAHRMQTAWIQFARSGCPEHAELPEWPSYTTETRSSMTLGTECTLRDDPHERARHFWGRIIANASLPWAQA